MATSPISPQARRPLSLALVFVLVLSVVGLAGPAAAQQEQGDQVAPCLDEQTYTVNEYTRMTDPGQDEIVQNTYRFHQWGWTKVKVGWLTLDVWGITASAWLPLPDSSLYDAFWAAVGLYEEAGWVFDIFGGSQTQVVHEATDPTYETAWFESDPGEDWTATGAPSEDRFRSVEVPCPCPEGTVGDVEPSCEPECEFVDGLAASDPSCGGPIPPIDPGTPTQPEPTLPEPTVPESTVPEPTVPEREGAEVGGITETTFDSGQLASGAETGGAQLPRTGGDVGGLLLVGGLLAGLGATLRTASRRLR